MVTIGSGPGTPDDIAAFTYTCDGEVASVARNRGRLQASLRYGSPGWVEALEIRSNGAQPACAGSISALACMSARWPMAISAPRPAWISR